MIGCDSYDDDFVPYGLKGLDVYVYNDRTDREFFAGRVEGNYFSKEETISQCQSLADSFARAKLHGPSTCSSFLIAHWQ